MKIQIFSIVVACMIISTVSDNATTINPQSVIQNSNLPIIQNLTNANQTNQLIFNSSETNTSSNQSVIVYKKDKINEASIKNVSSSNNLSISTTILPPIVPNDEQTKPKENPIKLIEVVNKSNENSTDNKPKIAQIPSISPNNLSSSVNNTQKPKISQIQKNTTEKIEIVNKVLQKQLNNSQINKSSSKIVPIVNKQSIQPVQKQEVSKPSNLPSVETIKNQVLVNANKSTIAPKIEQAKAIIKQLSPSQVPKLIDEVAKLMPRQKASQPSNSQSTSLSKQPKKQESANTTITQSIVQEIKNLKSQVQEIKQVQKKIENASTNEHATSNKESSNLESKSDGYSAKVENWMKDFDETTKIIFISAAIIIGFILIYLLIKFLCWCCTKKSNEGQFSETSFKYPDYEYPQLSTDR